MSFLQSLVNAALHRPPPPVERGPARPPREVEFQPKDAFLSSDLPAVEQVRSQTTVSRPQGYFFGQDGKSAIEQGIRISCPALSGVAGASLTFGESGGSLIATLQEGDKKTELPALGRTNFLKPEVSTELPNGLTVSVREDLAFHVEIARPDQTGFSLTWSGEAPEFGTTGTHGAPDEAAFRGVDEQGQSNWVSTQREGRLQVCSSNHDWTKGAGYTAPESKQIFEKAKGILFEEFPALR